MSAPVDAGTSDRMLVQAVADGDTAALRLLYERHAPWLLARLSRRCSDPGLVDEVCSTASVTGRFFLTSTAL